MDLLIETSDNLFNFDTLIPSIYRAIALQRKDKAYDYLLDIIANSATDQACYAVSALSMYNYNDELKEKIIAIAKKRKSTKLNEAIEYHWDDE